MSKDAVSVFQLFEMFPTEESARLYLEQRRWNGNPTCPKCQATTSQYRVKRKGKEGYLECRHCRKVYTVRTGTIFERSHVPLHKWLFAIYQVVTARKGISSIKLSKELGVTQTTAWFMLQRIREACADDNDFNNVAGLLRGIVEADETYVGGKEKNKHLSKRLKSKFAGKTAVIGFRQRGGRVIAHPLPSTRHAEIRAAVCKSVAPGSVLCTDEHRAYKGMPEYTHMTVNHSARQYVKGKASTNSIESVWAVLKRAYCGIYHWFSTKHMQLYLNELCFRLNSGNAKIPILDRINSLLGMCFGKRLTWLALTA